MCKPQSHPSNRLCTPLHRFYRRAIDTFLHHESFHWSFDRKKFDHLSKCDNPSHEIGLRPTHQHKLNHPERRKFLDLPSPLLHTHRNIKNHRSIFPFLSHVIYQDTTLRHKLYHFDGSFYHFHASNFVPKIPHKHLHL
jgi:hypothetical protein